MPAPFPEPVEIQFMGGPMMVYHEAHMPPTELANTPPHEWQVPHLDLQPPVPQQHLIPAPLPQGYQHPLVPQQQQEQQDEQQWADQNSPMSD